MANQLRWLKILGANLLGLILGIVGFIAGVSISSFVLMPRNSDGVSEGLAILLLGPVMLLFGAVGGIVGGVLGGVLGMLWTNRKGRPGSLSVDVILKRFDQPDEITRFENGKFETVTLGGMTIGRATYQPGWKWSEDVGRPCAKPYCTVEHVGMVISGCATAAFPDGRVTELKPGDVFYVPPGPHDSWVVGNEPYVSLHFLGAANYAKN